jgi:hypothetical protein
LDASDFLEIEKKIGQPRDAMAAHLISGEEGLARELAESLTHDELITLVLFLERVYAFGTVEAVRRSGIEDEEAKRRITEQFRMDAAFKSLGFDDPL